MPLKTILAFKVVLGMQKTLSALRRQNIAFYGYIAYFGVKMLQLELQKRPSYRYQPLLWQEPEAEEEKKCFEAAQIYENFYLGMIPKYKFMSR